jgi:ketosteroid isomerase-like protein
MLAVLVVPAAAQPVKSDQETIIELEKAWNEAFYRKDVTFIESLLADEFVATYEDGSRADKKKELALTAAFEQQVIEAVQDDFTVKVFGDTAIVWFTLNLVGIKQGQRSELTLSYTDVWVLRDGDWRCVSAHSTRVPPK